MDYYAVKDILSQIDVDKILLGKPKNKHKIDMVEKFRVMYLKTKRFYCMPNHYVGSSSRFIRGKYNAK